MPRALPEPLSADHLMAAGLLKLVAVQNLRGLTCDLLFFVVPRRNPLDDTWEGGILREFVRYSVMMRATQRLVILTEYMVTLPCQTRAHCGTPRCSWVCR